MDIERSEHRHLEGRKQHPTTLLPGRPQSKDPFRSGSWRLTVVITITAEGNVALPFQAAGAVHVILVVTGEMVAEAEVRK